MVAPELAAERNDERVGRVESVEAAAMLDGVDDALRHAFLERFRLVRGPFELAVHLARRDQDRDLADARRDAGLESEIAVDRREMGGGLRAVELHAGRPLQAGDGRTRRLRAVVGSLAGLVEILALRQR